MCVFVVCFFIWVKKLSDACFMGWNSTCFLGCNWLHLFCRSVFLTPTSFFYILTIGILVFSFLSRMSVIVTCFPVAVFNLYWYLCFLTCLLLLLFFFFSLHMFCYLFLPILVTLSSFLQCSWVWTRSFSVYITCLLKSQWSNWNILPSPLTGIPNK